MFSLNKDDQNKNNKKLVPPGSGAMYVSHKNSSPASSFGSLGAPLLEVNLTELLSNF